MDQNVEIVPIPSNFSEILHIDGHDGDLASEQSKHKIMAKSKNYGRGTTFRERRKRILSYNPKKYSSLWDSHLHLYENSFDTIYVELSTLITLIITKLNSIPNIKSLEYISFNKYYFNKKL